MRRLIPSVLSSFIVLVSQLAAIGQAVPSGEVPEGLTADDWTSVRAAYEAGRHAAHATEDGYRVHNPGQQWRTRFDGRGFSTRPDTGDWTWGLELQRYGFAGSERAVADAGRVTAEGARVLYDWDECLTEWYLNDTRGLEHGYTVHERPFADGGGVGIEARGPLIFTLSVRGDLTPVVTDAGRSVRFVDEGGAAVLTYAGLTVFDADGRDLPARFERIASGLSLSVDESGARYPLTIDPVAQQAYLKASNTEIGDQFGWSVAVSDDTVVIGAKFEDSNATGVNGDQTDNSATKSGAAYVFVRDGTGWSQQAYLKASNAEANDQFGFSVSASGDTIVVGAFLESGGSTGVNGDQASNSAPGAGAAYVFVRNGTSWSQQAYLKASNTEIGDQFGWSVSVSGDTVVAGSIREASNATGVDGDQSDNSATEAGAAYVFARNGTSWSPQAYLKASYVDGYDQFGHSVSASGDTIVVGALFESGGSTGVNGDPTSSFIGTSGAAYVFVRDGTSWSQQAYLKASNTGGGDWFGWAVAVSGDTVVVGAHKEGSNASGVDGDQLDNSLEFAGAAYVFARDGTSWSQQAYLKASNPGQWDIFGSSVAVSGDTVVVGARSESSNATGVDGDGTDDSFASSGAAYVFTRSGSTWSQQAYLKASNTGESDWFGWAAAVSGDTVVVGAHQESSSAVGVNGDQGNDAAVLSGAVYVFEIPADAWTDEGSALPGVFGDPLLVASGPLSGGSANALELSNCAPSATAGLFFDLSSTPTPFKGGTLLVLSMPIIVPTSPAGTISVPLGMPVGVPAGTQLWFQFAIEDAAAIQGFALSNAMRGITP